MRRSAIGDRRRRRVNKSIAQMVSSKDYRTRLRHPKYLQARFQPAPGRTWNRPGAPTFNFGFKPLGRAQRGRMIPPIRVSAKGQT